MEPVSPPQSRLRRRILISVGAVVLLSLLGSTLSLFRITEVNRSLDAINRVLIPLGRLYEQIQSDAEILQREMDRRLGYAHWQDPHWRPRPIPRWIEDVLGNEIERAAALVKKEVRWSVPGAQEQWKRWVSDLSQEFERLKQEAFFLYQALDKKDEQAAAQVYPRWIASLEAWKRQLQWGAMEYDRTLRQSFSKAENRVSELRTGLQVILVVVLFLSLLVLWLGERALRPLGDLTRLARAITERGLRKEDKSALPEIPLSRHDEVSQLAREFHRMATALLEREKTVELQKDRLQEQNRQLREMGALRERLQHAENLAAVGRMSAQVAHEVRNPLHSIGLEAEIASEMASRMGDPVLKSSLASILASVDRLEKIIGNYLRLTRLSSGHKSEVNLGEVLESVLATYATQCEAQKVKVDWSRESHSVLEIHGDRDLLEQALGNLMRNALQALEEREDGQMKWSLGCAESGFVWLKVQDNGPGIPLAIRPRLFTPFVTTRAEGTGLGLSFVKRVVEDHGGTIQCLDDSDQMFGGASFEIRLPSLALHKECSINEIKENSLGG